jgi:hypothetical protein
MHAPATVCGRFVMEHLMSDLTDEDQEVDRQPSLTIKRASKSRRMKEAERPEPPLESIVQSAQELNHSRSRAPKTGIDFERLFMPKEAAQFLRVSVSWLAKARMRGDGPPYVKLGHSVRYRESALVE